MITVGTRVKIKNYAGECDNEYPNGSLGTVTTIPTIRTIYYRVQLDEFDPKHPSDELWREWPCSFRELEVISGEQE